LKNPDSRTEEEPELFRVDPHHPERTLRIGSNLHPLEKIMFKQFLSENMDVLAWSPTDMSRIDPKVICHNLSIRAYHKMIMQKPRRMNEERSRAINDEVDRLL